MLAQMNEMVAISGESSNDHRDFSSLGDRLVIGRDKGAVYAVVREFEEELEVGGDAITQPVLVGSGGNKTPQYSRLTPRVKSASKAARKSAPSHPQHVEIATSTHRDEPDCACKACSQNEEKENQTPPPTDNVEEKQENSHQQLANSFKSSRKSAPRISNEELDMDICARRLRLNAMVDAYTGRLPRKLKAWETEFKEQLTARALEKEDYGMSYFAS